MNTTSNLSVFLATHLLFLTSSVVASLTFYLASRRNRWEILGTALGAVLLAWRLGLYGNGYASVMLFLCYWSTCAFAVTFFAPLLFPRQINERTPVLVRMVAPPLLSVVVAVLLGAVSRVTPYTLDYYLYAADASFGAQFGFAGARLLAQSTWLRIAAECAYINVPVAMAIGYQMRPEHDRNRFLYLLLLMSIAGFACYLVFPAAGSIALFGREFPFNPPAVSTLAIVQAPDLRESRNCIPSLHAAWGLALWWTRPRTGWMEAVGLPIYLALFFLYTLSCGHYLVDLIAALPFTLVFYSLTRRNDPRSRLISAAGIVMFLAWLFIIRFATPILMMSVFVPWTLTIVTLLSCHVFRTRIDRSA